MVCPECGRKVRRTIAFCPYCGIRLLPQKQSVGMEEASELQIEGKVKVTPRKRTSWGCGSTTLLIVAISFAVLIILASAALGIYQGVRERNKLDSLAASEHFNKGLAYLGAGEYELAIAELESAVRLDPNNGEAKKKLEEARAKLTVAPTPTSVLILDTAATYFSDGRSLYERGLWDEAIAKLEAVLALDPTYKQQEVADMLFACYYNSGIQLASEDRMEEALLRWNLALEIRPGDAGVKRQQKLASLYLSGMGYWQADWEQAIENFAELYEMQPGYKDVAQRLHDARVSYGDRLYETQQWCVAQAQYEGALEVRDSPEVRAKLDDTTSQCANPPEGTGTPEPGTGTPAPPGGIFVGRFVEYLSIEEHLMLVRGHVYDVSGKGMPGIQVRISAYDWSAFAVTDGAGLFSFDGLSNPLTYTLTLIDLPVQPVDVLAQESRLAWTEFRQTP